MSTAKPKAPKSVTITLPPLHRLQREIAECPARFRVASCGRRFGKTRLAQRESVRVALEGGRVWWIAPNYGVASSSWRDLRALVRQIPGVVIREADRELGFPTGGAVRVRSADAPDSLRGESLDLAVLDEAAFMVESVWTEAIRPTLADRRGRALFLSTPRGRNWFWRAYVRGLDPAEKEWAAFAAPTSANPYIAPDEIEAARSSQPERVFRQEFLAEFSDDAGDVFRSVRDCATAEHLEKAAPGRKYVMGIDWGKSNDFTVLTVFDRASGAMVAFERFNQIDFVLQRGRVLSLADRFRPEAVVAESNSIGTPNIEVLQRDGLPIRPFTTTNASKAEIIDALSLAFEQRTIRILPEPALLGELEAFEMERLPSGALRYAAPEGMHDDCVMSTALGWFAVNGGGVSGRNFITYIENQLAEKRAREGVVSAPVDVDDSKAPRPCRYFGDVHAHDALDGRCLDGNLNQRVMPGDWISPLPAARFRVNVPPMGPAEHEWARATRPRGETFGRRDSNSMNSICRRLTGRSWE